MVAFEARSLPFKGIPGDRNPDATFYKSCATIAGNAKSNHSLLLANAEDASVRALTDAISIKSNKHQGSIERQRSRSKGARSKTAKSKKEEEKNLLAQREFKKQVVSQFFKVCSEISC